MRSIQQVQLDGLSEQQKAELLNSDQELLELESQHKDAQDADAKQDIKDRINARMAQAGAEKGFVPSEKAIIGRRVHSSVISHSPRMTKRQRRERRRNARALSYFVQKFLIKRKTYEVGILKMKQMYSDVGEPGYDDPKFITREGPRRKQKRVRGKLQPLRNQPQRVRTDRRAA